MQYTGAITHILPIEQVGQNNTDKRSIVLEEIADREFKGSLMFDLRGDRCSLADGHNVGDVVTVSLNSKAREYNGRRFNGLTGWRIEAGSADSSAPAAQPSTVATPPNTTTSTATAAAPAKVADAPKAQDDGDELPF